MAGDRPLNDALRPIEIARVAASRATPAPDVAVVEEPLEIRLNGMPFVVIMRTPGADRELAAGFLFSERIIGSADDLGIIRHCVDEHGENAPNVVNVALARTIDDLMTGVEPVRVTWRVPARLIDIMPGVLRAAQDAFSETGGLHAAGLFDRAGHLVASAEDVGRHNAVDKVIGAQLLMERVPLDERLLFVSGRAGYEIVQKALVARVPIVASVSAPSSLAIDLAREGGITLLGFVRGDSFNVYTGAERIDVS
jgi:FdhD protein